MKKIVNFCTAFLAAFFLLAGFNIYEAKADISLPHVNFVGIEHSPLVAGDSESVYITSDYSGQVQYSLFMSKVGSGEWTDVSNGYLNPIDAKTPCVFKFPGQFEEGKYIVSLRVKRADTAGVKSNAYGDYDSAYAFSLNCVNKDDNARIYSDGDLDITKDNYKVGEKVVLNGIKNIRGMQGSYVYKLHVYDCSTGEWVVDNNSYRSNPYWIPSKPGTYVLDTWVMPSDTSELSSLSSNPKFEAYRIKIVTVTDDNPTTTGSAVNVDNPTNTANSDSYKALADASIKSMDIKSKEEKTNVNLNIGITGFGTEKQKMPEVVSNMLKNISVQCDTKTIQGNANLAAKAQTNLNIQIAGNNIPLTLWSDVDLTGDTPKEKIIFTIPDGISFMVPELEGKKYMVMDPFNMSEDNSVDYSKLMALIKEFAPQMNGFIKNYMSGYNPPTNFVVDKGYMDIADGNGNKVNVHCYEIKLNNEEMRSLLKYTIQNFVKNKDGMDFVKSYLESCMDMVNSPDKDKEKKELDDAFSNVNNDPTAFLQSAYTVVDDIINAGILGDNGITADCYVDGNGYIVGGKGSFEIVIDTQKINSAFSNLGSGAKDNTSDEQNGVITMNINYDSNTYNINGNLDIEMPETNDQNSIDYAKFLEDTTKKAK